MNFAKAQLDEQQQATLDALAPSGYILTFNYSWAGPELFECTFPDAWQEHYHSRAMWKADPITLWILANDGSKRWSHIKLTKMNSLLLEASEYGLAFGAVFARTKRFRKSVLSVARPDREYTDSEMDTLENWFDDITRRIDDRFGLTSKEIETLKHLASGLSIGAISGDEGVSDAAINKRIKAARVKLGQPNALAAVAFAIEQKLI